MAQHDAVNFGNRWQYSDDLDDHVDEDNIQGVGLDLNAHDHSDANGLPTKRVNFGAFADRPASGHRGHVYVGTDSQTISWDDGVNWHDAFSLDVASVITASNKFNVQQQLKEIATPAAAAAGYLSLYAKSDGLLYTINSSGTESPVGIIPTGMCVPYFGTVLPPNTLWADGHSEVIATYTRLSGIIRGTLGGADVSHFYVPDMRSRTAIGADNYGTGAASRTSIASGSSTGGEDTHVMTVGETAVHHHGPGTSTAFVGDPGNAGFSIAGGNLLGDLAITGDTGSGTAHNNRPLYTGCTWVVGI